MVSKRFTRAFGRSISHPKIDSVMLMVFLLAGLLFGCVTHPDRPTASQPSSQGTTDETAARTATEIDDQKETPPTPDKEKVAEAEKVWREPITDMVFVRVPEGCYQMGCGPWTGDCDKDGKPVHEVCVDGFWMAKYEVTYGQWMKIIKTRRPEIGKGDNHPVENISWNDAKEFIELLNTKSSDGDIFRLPTEAEWEYACRSGGKPEVYSGGNEIEAVAWYRENSDKTSHEVGTKEPNGLGIYDMSGNVREWCEDRYSGHAYSRHQQYNPLYGAGGSRRVIRGGSWRTVDFLCRSTSRYRLNPSDRHSGVGFRILRTHAEEKSEEKRSDAIKETTRITGTVIVTMGNMRSGPSRKHEVLAWVKKGEKVTIIRRKDKWYYVRLENGRTGWCHQSLLKLSGE